MFEQAEQVLAVAVLAKQFALFTDLFSGHPSLPVGNLFRAADLESLSGIDYLDKVGCLKQ